MDWRLQRFPLRFERAEHCRIDSEGFDASMGFD